MKKKTIWIAAGVLLAAVLLFVCIWQFSKPAAQEGSKEITVEVQHADGSENTFTYHTDEEYLRPVLEENGLISGEESEYGLYVTQVDGETADYSTDQSWWCLQVNGTDSMYGVDETVVEDGNTYTWIYTIG